MALDWKHLSYDYMKNKSNCKAGRNIRINIFFWTLINSKADCSGGFAPSRPSPQGHSLLTRLVGISGTEQRWTRPSWPHSRFRSSWSAMQGSQNRALRRQMFVVVVVEEELFVFSVLGQPLSTTVSSGSVSWWVTPAECDALQNDDWATTSKSLPTIRFQLVWCHASSNDGSATKLKSTPTIRFQSAWCHQVPRDAWRLLKDRLESNWENFWSVISEEEEKESSSEEMIGYLIDWLVKMERGVESWEGCCVMTSHFLAQVLWPDHVLSWSVLEADRQWMRRN